MCYVGWPRGLVIASWDMQEEHDKRPVIDVGERQEREVDVAALEEDAAGSHSRPNGCARCQYVPMREGHPLQFGTSDCNRGLRQGPACATL